MKYYIMGFDQEGDKREMLLTRRSFATMPEALSYTTTCSPAFRPFVVCVVEFTCILCGQYIDDGRACGCGAR